MHKGGSAAQMEKEASKEKRKIASWPTKMLEWFASESARRVSMRC